MTDPRQAAQMALDALEDARHTLSAVGDMHRVGVAHTAESALRAALSAQQEPVAFVNPDALRWLSDRKGYKEAVIHTGLVSVQTDALDVPLYTHPAPTVQPLTQREIELLDVMIEVQLHHAKQCDSIANRTMAEKQKGWDMERVALLRKVRAYGIGE